MKLVDNAKFSSQLCNCEGLKSVSKSPIQICKDYGHTSCQTCAVNPQREYEDTIPQSLRIQPSVFERIWRSQLPSRVRFDNFPDVRDMASSNYYQTSTTLQVELQKPKSTLLGLL